MPHPYPHRTHAGRMLARSLTRFAGAPGITVLGVPNGGVPIAFEVALALHSPLDLCLIEPLVAPERNATFGLLGWPPVQQLHEPVVTALGLEEQSLRQGLAQAWRRLRRRGHALRPTAPPPPVAGRTIILVDEGVVRGLLLRDAAGLLRRAGARSLVAAVPVGARGGLRLLVSEFDDVICPWEPESFGALASCYEDFRPVTDEGVRGLLLRAWRGEGRGEAASPGTS